MLKYYKIRLFTGSLLNPSILGNYTTKILEISSNKNWGKLVEVIVPFGEIGKIQKEMVKHYDDPVPWYFDGESVQDEAENICGFGSDDGDGGKLFVFDKGDLETYSNILVYGINCGIPIEVMDFLGLFKNIPNLIRVALEKEIDQKYKIGSYNYFKEKVNIIGVRAPIVDRIAKKYFILIKLFPKENIFELCEELLAKQTLEESGLSLNWVFRLKKQFESKDFFVFESWFKKYVTNWATCDDLCTHPLGHFLLQYPEHLSKLKGWANSSNMRLRRASAVSLIPSVRIGKNINHAFVIADTLLVDKEDLVQKGYGWMLKEMTKFDSELVFNYVMQNKKIMPRTALRYAIEKLPEKMKKEAMAS